jgi:hypothetical protein
MVSMRDVLKSSGRWLSGGWYVPLILLALPACALDSSGIPNPNGFDPGTGDLSSAVMCDIPKPTLEGTPECADATDVGIGISLSKAAVSLADGSHNSLALDFSPGAVNACNGFPRKIDHFGPFPDGKTICLNCAQQIPAKFSGPQAVCIAACKDLVSQTADMSQTQIDAFCQANARVATNFAGNICFSGACSQAGNPLPNFNDPRRAAEPVKWTDLIGASLSGNSLTRTAPTTGPDVADFNAGGASEQLITKGDAWVEFEANNTNLSQVLGVRGSCNDPSVCPDTDPSLTDIGFSIILNTDGFAYVIESDPLVTVTGPFGQYTAGERYRIHITDNNDGTATISYSRVVGSCTAGTPCNETQISQQVTATKPKYPLRINASFREQNATVANVTVMRIQ